MLESVATRSLFLGSRVAKNQSMSGQDEADGMEDLVEGLSGLSVFD